MLRIIGASGRLGILTFAEGLRQVMAAVPGEFVWAMTLRLKS